MSDPAKIVEDRDSLDHLAARGFDRLLKVLEDPDCFNKRGRVIYAAIARRLKINAHQAKLMLDRASEALQ
jgi:hypothetical protein